MSIQNIQKAYTLLMVEEKFNKAEKLLDKKLKESKRFNKKNFREIYYIDEGRTRSKKGIEYCLE